MDYPIPLTPSTAQTLSGLAGLFDVQATERDTKQLVKFVQESMPLLPSGAEMPDRTAAEYARAARAAGEVLRFLGDTTKAYLGLPNALNAADVSQVQQDAAKTADLNTRDAFTHIFGRAPSTRGSAIIIGSPEPIGLIYHFFQLDGLYDEALERYSQRWVQDGAPSAHTTSLSLSRTPEELGHAYAFYRAMQIREAFPYIMNGSDPKQVMKAVYAKPPTDYLTPRDAHRFN